MREIYKQDLEHLGEDLERMARQVARATDRARVCLRDNDLVLAEQTIDADDRIDELADEIEANCLSMLALQGPVASDLRLIIGALKLSDTLERIGDFARHVASMARNSYPQPAAPEPIQTTLNQMADVCASSTALLVELITDHDLELADKIIAGDDLIDDYHLQVRRQVQDPANDLDRSQIVNATLMSRFWERLGDHTLKAANRVVFIIRGERALHGSHN
ncbi:phosphate transport system regulatory protein PhoU [Boudabousia tangfeifanii]|uniref:Phosphate-specific transport system accessory protein PhoU n=1 Tax=Boudabousia tangfeifanii TaxID=1912795 RepID=A0A1D9MLN2_9ACTO|nr:phosphate signaling complex protein PhoU [Boudabousia tangfeifanii]AOZ73291.1 phosphate transport system regulatory protein PhoU [Boudabousia tangfeifanii]